MLLQSPLTLQLSCLFQFVDVRYFLCDFPLACNMDSSVVCFDGLSECISNLVNVTTACNCQNLFISIS